MINYKNLIVLFTIILIGFTAQAQNIRFIHSGFKLESTNPDISNFELSDKRYIFYESENIHAHLRVDLQVNLYDMEGNPKNTFRIDPGAKTAEPNYFEGLFPVGDQLILFKSGYDTKTKTTNLYAYTIEDDGTKGEARIIASIKAQGLFNTGSFQLATSPDKQMVILLSNLPHERKLNEKLKLTIFDAALNTIKEKQIELPYPSKKARTNAIFINNTAMVFLLKRVKGKKSIPDRDIVHTFSPDLNAINTKEHSIGTKGVISSYKTLFNTNGELMIGGMYYDFKKSGVNIEDPDGVFLTRCNEKGELISTFNVNQFTRSWQTNQLIATTDGAYYLLSEKAAMEKETVGDATAPTTNEHFTNKDAMVYKFDNQQKIAWSYLVERDELKSTNDGAKANRVWAGLLPNNQLMLVYRDAYARHDGKEHKVVTYPMTTWTSYVLETLGTDGKVAKSTTITNPTIAGPSGSTLLIPQSGKIIGDTLHIIGFQANDLISVVISEL